MLAFADEESLGDGSIEAVNEPQCFGTCESSKAAGYGHQSGQLRVHFEE